MKYITRIFYTAEQRAVMWDCYKRGESIHTIAKLINRGHSSIQGILAKTGGIRPPDCKRAKQALSLSEREEVSRGLADGLSFRAIARNLNRSPQQFPAKLIEMEGKKFTVPLLRMKPHGYVQTTENL